VTTVSRHNSSRAPLLFLANGKDHTVPAVSTRAAYKIQRRRRAHRAQGVPRPLPLHLLPGRLGEGGRLLARLGRAQRADLTRRRATGVALSRHEDEGARRPGGSRPRSAPCPRSHMCLISVRLNSAAHRTWLARDLGSTAYCTVSRAPESVGRRACSPARIRSRPRVRSTSSPRSTGLWMQTTARPCSWPNGAA